MLDGKKAILRCGKLVFGKGFSLEGVASSVDKNKIPAPEKPKIDENSQRDIIKYKDRVFEVPAEIISYLASLPENLNARIKRTARNGMGFMHPDGVSGCFYCNHYLQNIADVYGSGMDKPFMHSIVGEIGIYVRGCQYKRAEDVRWATIIENPKKERIMAQLTPCVINDSLIAELCERGLLDGYESGKEFNFPAVAEIIGDRGLLKKYDFTPRKSLVERISEGIKSLRRK